MICFVCKVEKRTLKHHISYLPPEKVNVCWSCHNMIHDGKYPELLPSNRLARIRHAHNGFIKVFRKKHWYFRELTEFEKELRKEMIKLESLSSPSSPSKSYLWEIMNNVF